MRIRPATIADIPTICSLAREIWYAHYPGIITVEQIEFMLEWMYSPDEIERQMSEHTRWELAEHDGKILGFLSYELEADRRVKLHKLYIGTAHQRQGYGQQILAHVLDCARQLGGTEVWMQVNKRNTAAIVAYQKAGFHIAREATFDIGRGFVMDDYLMAKSVANPT